MVRLILLLCSLPLVGCGFLDDDLLLDDDEFEFTMYGTSSGGTYSSSCGSRRIYRRSTMHLGELHVYGEAAEGEDEDYDDEAFDVDFEDEDIRATHRPKVILTSTSTLPSVDPWLSEFVRLEDEQLRANTLR